MKELAEQWKASVIVHIYLKGEGSDYQDMSILSSKYSIFSNTVLSL